LLSCEFHESLGLSEKVFYAIFERFWRSKAEKVLSFTNTLVDSHRVSENSNNGVSVFTFSDFPHPEQCESSPHFPYGKVHIFQEAPSGAGGAMQKTGENLIFFSASDWFL
jgi:hypothetical protein